MENQIITKAIVLRATLFQDSDKILTLFSVEHGKISAKLKSCTKANAKLKFAGQPFCFAEFSLLKRGENFVVITATEIASFFNLSQNFETLSLSMAVLEICNTVLAENQPNVSLFLNTLKALNGFDDKINPKIVLSKFFLDVFKNTGYELLFDGCKNCGLKFHHSIFLEVETGAFLCPLCKTESSMQISLGAFSTLRMINNQSFDKLQTFSASNNLLDQILVLLSANFTGKFNYVLKSLKNL